MCTVTYLPVNTQGSFILTSNRDERINRPALPPSRYNVHGKELIFPKDLEKEGTWICVHTSWVLCLLNGAFVKHKHEPPYRKSRGIVLLDFYSFSKPEDFANYYDFTGVEPFTLLILGLEKPESLYEFRWDGHKALLNVLDASIPHIRSSATLYTPEVVKMREDWFDAWIKEHSEFTQEAILDFHHFSDSGERSHDVLMQKNELLKTVSITSISRLDQRLGIKHEDLLKETVDSCSLIVLSRWNWEFWPWYIFYAPLFPYLIIQIIKHSSFRFFYNANPGMYRGGLVGERKSDILNLVPSSWVPPWTLVQCSANPKDVLQQLNEHNLSFPLIGKPDIGERGEGIKLLNDVESWKLYHQNQSQNYLLQTYCDMPVEAGIFYARLPGSQKGKIISLCTKEMMKVTGDGLHTVEDLLMLNERNYKHLDRLRKSSGILLQSIPKKEQLLLVEPIGNHCRGTIFLDSSAWITTELEQSLDTLCTQISGFYYGRLDVKAPSELALKEGKGLQILEVNGISSEPGHIYQPGFSLWQAWRDVLTCWRWMVVIAEKNHK